MKKLLGFALLAAASAAVASAPSISEACRCMAPRPVADRLATTDAVFYGKVVAREDAGDRNTGTSKFTFEVRRIWKGELGRTIRVHANRSPAACGTSFTRGSNYLIFASKSGRSWRTGVCANNLSGGGATMGAAQLGPRWWAPANADGSCPRGTNNVIRCIRAPCPVKCMPSQG